MYVPLGRELALLVGCHKRRRKPVCAQVEGALRAPTHVVDQGDGPLVWLALVEVLVLDGVQVDKVPHARAGVPAHVVRVHVDLTEELDHLIAVCDVLLGAGSGRCEVCSRLVLSVGLCGRYVGEGERVCDFQHRVLFHADYTTRRNRRERLAAGSSDFNRNLRANVSPLLLSKVAARHVDSTMAGRTVGGLSLHFSYVPGRRSALS